MSVSYCHCDNPCKERRLISLDDLRAGILYAMKENLMIQFVYPDYPLPQEYLDVIETIDHHNIKPAGLDGADVSVLDSIDAIPEQVSGVAVLRIGKKQLFESEKALTAFMRKVQRLNVVITDVETFIKEDLQHYGTLLENLANVLREEYLGGNTPQLNLLTDRMMLDHLNHCNAGVENITLAPNGRFYLCPAFYYSDAEESVGDLKRGLDIKNQQLLRLDHAPLCRHCDAYHCRRCVWLNRKTTYEVNTPSHEQCVVAHTERGAARQLLATIREQAVFMPEIDIKEINYTDPFDVRKEW